MSPSCGTASASGRYDRVERHELDIRGAHAREIRPLEIHDARVLAQRAKQLAVPGVDGVDALRAVAEQRAREAAGRCAGVERHPALHLHGECGERGFELRLAAQGLLARCETCELLGKRSAAPRLTRHGGRPTPT
jgi:hypothetical protein